MFKVTQLVRIARKFPTRQCESHACTSQPVCLTDQDLLNLCPFISQCPFPPHMRPSTSQPAGGVWRSNNSGRVTFNFPCWLWASGTQVTQQGAWAAAVVLPAHLCPSFFLDEISVPLLNSSTSLWSQEPTHLLSSVMDMLQWFFLFSSVHQFFSPPARFTSIFISTPLTSLHLTSLFLYSKSPYNVWPRSWERLTAGGEDGWRAALTQWTWVWANFGRQWRTGKPGMLQFVGS